MLSQLLGYLIVSIAGLPVPAPVVGLVFLFVYLLLKQQVPQSLLRASSVLLPLLPLFLLPASVGIVEHSNLLLENATAITAALVISLLASIAITPFVFQFFMRVFRNNQ
jgi:holin-like protein